MKRFFLLSAFGKDRPGIVAGVTDALFKAGANIEDASMTRLGGEFSIMLVAALPGKTAPAQLSKALAPLRKQFGVECDVKAVPQALALARQRTEPGTMISVYGTDKPGIVSTVTRLLARRRVNITDLNTKVLSTSGADLYIMMLEVQLPKALSSEALREDLEVLKTSLGVDITLHDIDAVSLDVILDVVRLPDPRLKRPSEAVSLDWPGLAEFIENMLETMRHHPRCVGLAAPQVGKNWQVITVNASRVDRPGSQHGELALLNPRLVRLEGPKLLREGCLSVPDYTGNVVRATLVELQAIDREGRPRQIVADGFEAVVFQHELDHLEGKLFLDRVASLSTDVFRRQNYG